MTVLEVEKALVRKAQRKDAEAFTKLWQLNQRHLRNFLRKRIADDELIKDTEQQTALRCWLKLRQFNNKAPFHFWLFTVAFNEYRQILRKLGQKPTAPLEGLEQDVIDRATVSQAPSPERIATARHDLKLICMAACKLKRKHQEVWYQRDILGKSSGEAANVLRLPVPATKSRLHKARAAIFRSVANG